MSTKVEVNKEEKEYMITAIKAYFLKERDEDLGDLAASLILDFFLDQLAPSAYNQGFTIHTDILVKEQKTY